MKQGAGSRDRAKHIVKNDQLFVTGMMQVNKQVTRDEQQMLLGG